MKNKANKITLLYILFSIVLALVCYYVLDKFHTTNDLIFLNFSFLKDVVFILFSGIIFKVVLTKNDNRNNLIFERLKATNEEIKESNERYDIVAKATSDTIWDWKIQEDDFIWNRGIQSVFGYEKEEVGITS